MREKLVVFVKAPVEGTVKTRLLTHLSALDATLLYRVLVEDTFSSLYRVFSPSSLLISYWPNPLFPDPSWIKLAQNCDWFVQCQGHLGLKINQAFEQAFSRGAAQVLVLGTDAPHVRVHEMQKAFHILEKQPFVIGPTIDGGFYLAGLISQMPQLFDSIPWSTSSVFNTVMRNASSLKVDVGTLAPTYDIDTIEDAKKLLIDLEKNEAMAPLTFQFLKKILAHLN